jgi:hypothetical protein
MQLLCANTQIYRLEVVMYRMRMALATGKACTLALLLALLYVVQAVSYYRERSKAHMVHKATLVFTAGAVTLPALSSKRVNSCYQCLLYTTDALHKRNATMTCATTVAIVVRTAIVVALKLKQWHS